VVSLLQSSAVSELEVAEGDCQRNGGGVLGKL
jgi:hypothetical protein